MGILIIDRVRKVTEGLINDEEGGFRTGRRCVGHILTLKHIGKKAREKKCRVYVCFMDLEKAYDKVNREVLWQALRMYYVGDKLLNGIKRVYVDSLACVRIKGCESECFRIDCGVRQVCIMSPWLFDIWMQLKMGVGRRGGKRVEIA